MFAVALALLELGGDVDESEHLLVGDVQKSEEAFASEADVSDLREDVHGFPRVRFVD